MATFDEFYRSLSEDSNKRGEYFEKVFIPWFLKTDPVWSTKVNQVWLWDDYPQRWGRDCGIDLVYEDNQGKHWAIQSKCVSPDREISKAEIDSFLSESSDSRIHGRLLIASTDGIGKNAQQVIDRREKEIVCFLLEHFRQSEVDFPSSPEDLSTGQRKEKRTPRPHQLEAINNVVEGLQKEDRGQLLMACGTGKTLTSLWIKEALKVKRTLVLLPSLSLLSQTLREWSATSQEKFNWICVCSDKSVAKQDKTTDSMIENVSALGVPVTSDPEEIKRFLLENNGGIIFSTYQSSPLVEESQRSPEVPAFDIAFADEAHRCAGKVSGAFASILDEQKIRSKKRLFMTATPRVLSKQIKKKADEENINLACMDDVSQFGEVFHQLNFSEAIEKELLSDYQVVIVGVDDPSVQAQIIDRMLVDTGNECNIDTETLANHIALAKAIKDYDLSRMITFHSRVKSAKKFSEDHPLILDWIPEESKSSKSAMTSYVSGEMNAKSRNTEINKLRNISEQEVGILANARCLSEGVDVPTLDGIAFFDPRSSQVDIIQAVGRAIRKSENKTDGYIILPVYLGDTTNVEDEILQSRFKDIWSIILALKSQDDSMRDELDQLRVELGRRNAPTESVKGFSKIVFDLPSSISTTFADSLTTILVRETTENWMEMYGQLVVYFEEKGNCRVPPHTSLIGDWVARQRTQYNKKRLSKQQIELLEQINFTWDPSEADWQEKYLELVDYANKNDNTRVPTGTSALGNWVNAQRQQCKKGKLSDDRYKLLENIDFSWDPKEEDWKEKYKQLTDFVRKNFNAGVPTSHPILGEWVLNQRTAYKNNKLTPDKIKLLEELNFDWDPLETNWQNNFQKLLAFTKKRDSRNDPANNKSLRSWMVSQRAAYKSNKLSISKTEMLNKIDFVWDPAEADWQEKYLELVLFFKEKGHARVSSTEQDLGRWVTTQRKNHRKGELHKDKISLLEEIGFRWDPLEENWQNNYQELVIYQRKNGHIRVTSDNPTLANWSAKQRADFKAKSLSKEKIILLESIGFAWDPFNSDWEEKYHELKIFVETNGTSMVPITHPSLGRWIGTQRTEYKKDKLARERVKLLEDIGIVWDPIWEQWQAKYQELVRYAKENGNAKVGTDNPPLRVWVSKQRSDYKRKKLTEKQIKLLKNIEIVWDPLETDWLEKYQELVLYAEENGNSDIPQRHSTLGDWVTKQRRTYKKNKLPKDKIDLLNKVAFTWDPLEKEWRNRYEQLKEYIKSHGDTRVPAKYQTLGNWVSAQRKNIKSGDLSERRIQLLNEIGFIWDASSN